MPKVTMIPDHPTQDEVLTFKKSGSPVISVTGTGNLHFYSDQPIVEHKRNPLTEKSTSYHSIMGFAAWLTTRPQALTVGSKHPAGDMGRLVEEYLKQGDIHEYTSVAEARNIIWNAMEDDPGFKLGYVANIAMRLSDLKVCDGLNHKGLNKLAENLVELIFK